MISVENFYWILFENLLDPVNIDAWYYYPYGTTENLSQREFQRNIFRTWGSIPDLIPHVLFHFDQEPLWDDDLGLRYDKDTHIDPRFTFTWDRTMRILANSEHSLVKHKICKSRGFLDWYFFYHGFAALDWFGDSEFVDPVEPITKVYSSLNNLTAHKRSYRMALTARLAELGVLNFGDVSLHATVTDLKNEISDPCGSLSTRDKNLIDRYLCNDCVLPLTADTKHTNGAFSAHFGPQEYRFWQRSFLHLVNETVFYDHKLHLTEKTFKPIVSLRPFVLVAAPGNLAYLRSYGFQTFSPWIDESYDSVEDPELRLDMIATEVSKLCAKSMTELKKIHHDMLPVLTHNRQHFFGQFREIIVDELIQNFDTCVRLWNNSEVDRRKIPFHPDLKLAKQMLLGHHMTESNSNHHDILSGLLHNRHHFFNHQTI